MYLLTILLLICFATISSNSSSQWTQQSYSIIEDYCLSVGFYNGSIYLLGGYHHANQLTEYVIERNLFIDHGINALNTTFGIYGLGNYWTQIDHLLYVEETYGVSIFNMKTKAFASLVITNIPTDGGLYSCMTSNATHIFLVGGDTFGWFGGANSTISLVQIYDLSTNEWITSAPSMNSARKSFACIIHPITTKLYAIGGIRKTGGNEVYLSSIEMIESSDIARKTWTYINGTLSQGLAWCICEIYRSNIYVIGGGNSSATDLMATETVHIINVLTDEVSVLNDSLPIGVNNVAPIVVNHTLYVFGGWNKDYTGGINTWMMYDLYERTALPTEEPTKSTSFPTTAEPTAHPTTLLRTAAPAKSTLAPSEHRITFTSTHFNSITNVSTINDITGDRASSTTDIDAVEQIPSDASYATTDSLSTQYDKDIDAVVSISPKNLVIIVMMTLAVVILVLGLAIVNCICSKKKDTHKKSVEFMKRSDDKANNNNGAKNERKADKSVNADDAMMGFDNAQPVKHEGENSVSLESVGITQEGGENVENEDVCDVQTDTIGIVNDLDDVQQCETNPNIASDEFIIDGGENYQFTTVQ